VSINKKTLALRGGRSVRQVSRDQHELDVKNGEWRKIRNRMSWARKGVHEPERIEERV